MPWNNETQMEPRKFSCGHCGHLVASNKGFFSKPHVAKIYICPFCELTSFFVGNQQIPGVAPGNSVGHLPTQIEYLYDEARSCVAVGSHTAAVLTSRKILMHIAVAQGASEGDNFLSYVKYLAQKGYVPPGGIAWVDHIRGKGNEANHEIKIMSKLDAEELITFLEMLLKFIYEFPARIPALTQ